MFSTFTPQRGATESREEYADRRITARNAVRAMTLTGPFLPGKQTSRQQLREARRGHMGKAAGAYGAGLRNWINRKQAAAAANRVAK